MKKEKLVKIMLVIIMCIALALISTNTFALSDDDLYLDFSNSIDGNNTTNTSNTTDNTNYTNLTTTNTNNTSNNYNTNLPNTGLAENTMLGVAITLLAIISIYAYKKVKYYKNI